MGDFIRFLACILAIPVIGAAIIYTGITGVIIAIPLAMVMIYAWCSLGASGKD